MIDLYQVSVALENSTENSLVIIDEFGKGTLPADGIGLYAATIESFASRGALCPLILTATHFSEIFQYELIDPFPSDLLAQKTMEVTPIQDHGIAFLYRIIPGLAQYSWGLNCAEMAGIHERVLERAKEVAERLASGKSLAQSEDRVLGMLTDELEGAADRFVEMEMGSLEVDELFAGLGDMHK
jgi:DNA mismatch repair protein MSH5